MNYLWGMIKYILKSPLKNYMAMYIFGAGILAVLHAMPHLLAGDFVMTAFEYFMTKYLPPTSLRQFITQPVAGSVVAGGLWYIKTPRI